ncbi:helix-turn-helix domain-containing protein [Myxococcota bacterium]|nr:helix-turn-helix domain-containing protein [Myxococcota bacterium]
MGDLDLLTTSQVLDLLKIGRTKLWELVRDGAFPAYRIGSSRNSGLRYRRQEVINWLEQCRLVEPNGPGLGMDDAGETLHP